MRRRRKKAMKQYAFGIDVGGTTIKAGLFNITGKLVEKWEIPTRTENSGANILDDIADTVLNKMQQKAIIPSMVLGIGIGIPGPVDEKGIVRGCVNLGWGNVNVERELAKKTGLIVNAGNDANVAALGECWKGAAKGAKNSIMVTLGTGVGGGMVIGGKVLPGVHGASGEIGHMKISDIETEKCNCGNSGCLEQFTSATGIVRMTKKELKESDVPSVLREKEDITAKDVLDAAKAGDKLAEKVLEDTGDKLGKALAYISCVCDPEVFVIGGGVSKAGEILRASIEAGFQKYAFHACKETKVVLATLGNDAGIYGSVKLLLNE